MLNLTMERKIMDGEAIDLAKCERTPEGDYVITEYVDEVDYCDSEQEVWIWSIGRSYETGRVIASTSTKFYQNPDYECLWLR